MCLHGSRNLLWTTGVAISQAPHLNKSLADFPIDGFVIFIVLFDPVGPKLSVP